MRRSGVHFKFLSLVLVFVLLVANLGFAQARNAPTAEEDDIFLPLVGVPSQATVEETATYVVPAAAQAAGQAYWSYERRAAAQPQELPEAYFGEESAADFAAPVLGTPGRSPGSMPAAGSQEAAMLQFAAEWQRMEADMQANAALADEEPFEAAGTRGVYTSYLTNYFAGMNRSYPWITVGKLYIDDGGYCSAAVISSTIIVTAGHCVYDVDYGDWYSGWTFVPADRAGSAPYGTFRAAWATALTAYINTGAIRYDVAVLRLNTNNVGRPVSYYTGSLGKAWNYGYVRSLFSTGYPSNLSGGLYTYTCAAETFYKATDVLGMGCNMMHGSSGGPWLMLFRPYAPGNYVNAVVSGVPGDEPMGVTYFGPRFSSDNIVHLCNAEGC